MMNRRTFLCGLTLGTLAAPLAANAEQTGKVHRIGILRIGPSTEASTGTLRQALRELGYIEGRNIMIEDRTTEGRLDRLADVAAELVRLKVDVIIASGVAGTRAANGTSTSRTLPTVDALPAACGA